MPTGSAMRFWRLPIKEAEKTRGESDAASTRI
jgi:hypothetical protein